jgi:hypothetical protein
MAASKAKISYNEDFSEFSITLPNGRDIGGDDVPESGIAIVDDDEDEMPYLAVLLNFDDDASSLEKNTVYQLTPLDTDIEEGVEFEDDEDEEEEEAEEAPETTEELTE